ncbi:hypothetical protein SAMN02787142_7791 [Burkholderia sp. WP9]|uniref:hypothetical protein n=1 Tax=Burkholderia sp. WP9 TaxID=1500263 RepID=UPI000895F4C1|nr:hypothetical protein [Burkholderia sp. WP9]SEF11901.1 hypothetical protein SAMN02787142_7791 [Burkholderia sp. WP9]
MQHFFMTRASAVAYLLGVRRAMPEGIDHLRVGEADVRLQEVDTLNRLLLDVRAGRIREFRLDKPEAIEVMVTD